MTDWRLLISLPAHGALNMATDEAIVEAVARKDAPPTLRFFAWNPPCISLGYAQPLSDVDPERLAERGWDVVRRPTGGRAILHTDELTYSAIAPLDEPRVFGGVLESYRRLSAGLLRGVERLGLLARSDSAAESDFASLDMEGGQPICFETPSRYEITAMDKKLIGSAQVRKRGVVLQHGTLPLTGDIARICDALAFAGEGDREAAKARLRQRATTVAEVLGYEIGWGTAAEAMAAGFAEALDLRLVPGRLSADEATQADRLVAEKYGFAGWTKRL